MRPIFDKNGVQLSNNDIVDLHQTVNGQNLFVVLDVDRLDVRYRHDNFRKYEYNKEELFRTCSFSGEVDFEIVGKLEDSVVVYEHDFGHETYGEVRQISEGIFQCYETPLYGGEWHEAGDIFTSKEAAIEFLQSLT